MQTIIDAAVDLYRRGFTPVPVLERSKRIPLSGWQKLAYADEDEVRARFEGWGEQGYGNLGVLTGEPSGGLVDVDIDHPTAEALRPYFIPPSSAFSGRDSKPRTHYWYLIDGPLPETRRYKLPSGATSIEVRSTGSQTVVPPSVHETGEAYRWDSPPWGGAAGVSRIAADRLSQQVAFTALGAVLLDAWPQAGGRNDAYLALAGGLLRYGDGGVHPFWEQALPLLVSALAGATHDEDGAETRVAETVHATSKKLRAGGKATGLRTLAEIIGDEHVEHLRRRVDEVEALSGWVTPRAAAAPAEEPSGPVVVDLAAVREGRTGGLTPRERSDRPTPAQIAEEREARERERAETPEDERDPLEERLGSWEALDLDPYLAGRITPVSPSILSRADGEALLYPGRVNMLYGASESAKTWVALEVIRQEIDRGERALLIDLEDEPVSTISRLRALDVAVDDLRTSFGYIRPEEPLASMQRTRYGDDRPTDGGRRNLALFDEAISRLDPSLIVVDGMTVLYGLHGLDTNDATSTDVVTGWLKSLTRNGRSTVIVIDHSPKSSERGTLPLGSQHKRAMVQGTMLQVWATKKPMPGAVGVLELIVMKDRPGQVRAVSGPVGSDPSGAQIAAVVTMDSTTAGRVSMTIDAPPNASIPTPDEVRVDLSNSEAARKAEDLRRMEELILAAFGGELGATLRTGEVVEATGLSVRKVSPVLSGLALKGWLSRNGATSNTTWTLVVGEPDD